MQEQSFMVEAPLSADPRVVSVHAWLTVLRDPSIEWILGDVLPLALSVFGCGFALWAYFRGGGRRSVLRIGMIVESVIDPSTIGVAINMRIGRYDVKNLTILKITVKNEGPGDIEVPDPEGETHRIGRPRIDLPPGMRVLANPWSPGGATGSVDVRVARSLQEGIQRLHVHVHRLHEGREAVIRVLATSRTEMRGTLSSEDVAFMPGSIGDARVRSAGLLVRARHLDTLVREPVARRSS